MALWASATEEAETAYAAYQQARRTLREARHKQHAVKMSRQYYRPDAGGRRDDSRIVCMSCGKMGHRKANCPSSTACLVPPRARVGTLRVLCRRTRGPR